VAVLRESDAGRRFIDMLRSNEFTRRLRFLEYCPDAPSIMENFNVSQDRLPKPNGPALAVINFLGMRIIYAFHTISIVHKTLSFFSSVLETDIQDEEVHFQKFFFDHSCPLPPKDFPDREILESDEDKLLGIFSDLEKVSFGERLQAAEQGLKRFNFHPLWLECTRHSMGDKGRIRYARQVLFICYHTIIVDHGNINILSDCNDSFLPHVRRCLQVCKRFKLGLDNLKLPPKVSKVFRDIEGGV
jgi:hypothetical protein